MGFGQFFRRSGIRRQFPYEPVLYVLFGRLNMSGPAPPAVHAAFEGCHLAVAVPPLAGFRRLGR